MTLKQYFFVFSNNTDKQSPAPLNCTEEQELVVRTGDSVNIVFGTCDFHDNVIGKIAGTFVSPQGTTTRPAGDYGDIYF